MKVITSTSNPTIKAVVRLHRPDVRKREGRTLIEGPHAIEMAARAGARLEVVLAREGSVPGIELGGELHIVSDRVLRAASATENPRGPVAVVAVPEAPALSVRDTLALSGLGDPGNVGTLLRTATALGLQSVVLPGTVDVWSPKVLRAAAGAHWLAPPATVQGIEALAAAGLETVALVVTGGDPPDVALRGPQPVAILVGGEAHGLPPELSAAASRRLTIPMPGGVESLNAAVSGAIAMYERKRIGSAAAPTLPRRDPPDTVPTS